VNATKPNGEQDELISLETMVEESKSDNLAKNHRFEITPEITTSDPEADASVQLVDQILTQADPGFMARTQQLKAQKFEANLEPEDFDDEDLGAVEKKTKNLEAPDPKPRRSGLLGRLFAVYRLKRHRAEQPPKTSDKNLEPSTTAASPAPKKRDPWIDFHSLKQKTKTSLQSLPSRSLSAAKGIFILLRKAGWRGIVILLMASVLVLFWTKWFHSDWLPDFGVRLIPSVADRADRSWSVSEDETWEDFYSTLRHPEHVFQLDQVVVNLRPVDGSEPNPMGFFEFYLELSSQDVAIEVADRKVEVLDAIQRLIEPMSFDEIASVEGKNQIKTAIRSRLNEFLTQGKVRKVYFKSVILKP